MKKWEMEVYELMWLTQHGDRDSADVLLDDRGLKYVLMWNGLAKQDEREYLPIIAKEHDSGTTSTSKRK